MNAGFPIWCAVLLASAGRLVALPEEGGHDLTGELEEAVEFLPDNPIPWHDSLLGLPGWMRQELTEIRDRIRPANQGGGLFPPQIWPLQPEPVQGPLILDSSLPGEGDSGLALDPRAVVPLGPGLMGRYTMQQPVGVLVDPQQLIDQYGADTARLFVMFASPPEQTLEWNEAGVEGAHRFLKRLWNFGAKNAETLRSAAALPCESGPQAKDLRREVHQLLRQISHDYERMQYNTVVSGGMKLLNALEANNVGTAAAVVREGFGILLRTLYPACPHTTWTLWKELGYAALHGDLLDAPWPEVNESALLQEVIELMLQINGKLRGSVSVAASADKSDIERAALASPELIKFAAGTPVKRVVVVPGRLVTVVL